MGVSKESISKFLIGNRFHIKLHILSPVATNIVDVSRFVKMLSFMSLCYEILIVVLS